MTWKFCINCGQVHDAADACPPHPGRGQILVELVRSHPPESQEEDMTPWSQFCDLCAGFHDADAPCLPHPGREESGAPAPSRVAESLGMGRPVNVLTTPLTSLGPEFLHTLNNILLELRLIRDEIRRAQPPGPTSGPRG